MISRPEASTMEILADNINATLVDIHKGDGHTAGIRVNLLVYPGLDHASLHLSTDEIKAFRRLFHTLGQLAARETNENQD